MDFSLKLECNRCHHCEYMDLDRVFENIKNIENIENETLTAIKKMLSNDFKKYFSRYKLCVICENIYCKNCIEYCDDCKTYNCISCSCKC